MTRYPQPYAHSPVVTDQRDHPVVTLVALIAAVVTAGYMAPWLVAAARGKSNHLTVGVLNFLLGWTIVGWIVALIMAMGPHRVAYAAR